MFFSPYDTSDMSEDGLKMAVPLNERSLFPEFHLEGRNLGISITDFWLHRNEPLILTEVGPSYTLDFLVPLTRFI